MLSLDLLRSNQLLAKLPAEQLDRLAPQMTMQEYKLRDVIYNAGDVIPFVCFPIRGMFSIVAVMKEGIEIEVAVVGHDGFVGAPLLFGSDTDPNKAIVQIAAAAVVLPVEVFRKECAHSPLLQSLTQEYALALWTGISRSVACNVRHSAEQRMCRWLLNTHDRVQLHEFGLTQEFLAVMLGVRRPTVTNVAGDLQRAGAIRYSRGKVKLVDREELERRTCDCYWAVKKAFDKFLPPPKLDRLPISNGDLVS